MYFFGHPFWGWNLKVVEREVVFFLVTFSSRGSFHEQQTKAGQASGLRLCFACLILLFVFPL